MCGLGSITAAIYCLLSCPVEAHVSAPAQYIFCRSTFKRAVCKTGLTLAFWVVTQEIQTRWNFVLVGVQKNPHISSAMRVGFL